jgi:GH15 family glucan-1,4-alpha-glucosidase
MIPLLMIPLVGLLRPEDERVRATAAAIERDLRRGGLVIHYPTHPHVDPKRSGWLRNSLKLSHTWPS